MGADPWAATSEGKTPISILDEAGAQSAKGTVAHQLHTALTAIGTAIPAATLDNALAKNNLAALADMMARPGGAARVLARAGLDGWRHRSLAVNWPPALAAAQGRTTQAFQDLLARQRVKAGLTLPKDDTSGTGRAVRALVDASAAGLAEEVVVAWRSAGALGDTPSFVELAARALATRRLLDFHKASPREVGKLLSDADFERARADLVGFTLVSAGLARSREPEARGGIPMEELTVLMAMLTKGFAMRPRATGAPSASGPSPSAYPATRVPPPPVRGLSRSTRSMAEYKLKYAQIMATYGIKYKAMDRLLELTGLAEVKGAMLDIITKVLVERKMGAPGKPGFFNAQFLGNPGTGKTTVAELYGEILGDLTHSEGNGPLSGSAFVKTTGVELKNGGVDGLKKLLKDIDDRGGGVLMIDEAYGIKPETDVGGDLVNYLVGELSERVGKLVVVLTGYPDKMAEIFRANEGLARRVPVEFHFADFEDEELLSILGTELKKYNEGRGSGNEFRFQDSTPDGSYLGKYANIAVWRLGRGRGKTGFGNAGAVQTLFNQIMTRKAARYDKELRAFNDAPRGTVPEPNMLLVSRDDILGPRRTGSPLEGCRAWEELRGKVGLTKIKEAVLALAATVERNWALEEEERFAEVELPILNQVFLGNPGTGKTTTAELYGEILVHLGLLSVGKCEVVKPSNDLMDSNVGKTGPKTTDRLRASMGSVLLIDEAYQMGASGSSQSSSSDGAGGAHYGAQALDAIVNELRDHYEDRAVLMAGYTRPMNEMFRLGNPGLRRRFNFDRPFVFEDYSREELLTFLIDGLRRRSMCADLDAKLAAVRYLELQKKAPHFGNFGAVNNLIAAAAGRKEMRLQSEVGRGKGSGLIAEDFDPVVGADRLTVDKLFGDLSGLEDFKDKLRELERDVLECEDKGGDPTAVTKGRMTFIFRGATGTGKTTIASRLGKLFRSLCILPFDEPMLKSASELGSSFMGGSSAKTRATFEEARGRVLLLDEASQLTPAYGNYMGEVVKEMVACLTDETLMGNQVIILADYPDKIERLMAADQGLKSRFTMTIDIPNLAAPEATSALLKALEREGKRAVHEDARECVASMMPRIVSSQYFSNYRTVVDLQGKVDAAVRKRTSVLAGSKKDAAMAVVVREDVAIALSEWEAQNRVSVVDPGSETAAPPSAQFQPLAQGQSAQQSDQVVSREEAQEVARVEAIAEERGGGGGGGRVDIQVCTREGGVSDAQWEELEAAKRKDAKRVRELEEMEKAEKKRKAEKVARETELANLRMMLEAAVARAAAANEVKLHESEIERENRTAELARHQAEVEESRKSLAACEADAARAAEAAKEADAKLQQARAEDQYIQRVRNVLRQLNDACPKGFAWERVSGGWRCGGGSHFRSEAEVAALLSNSR